MHNSQWYAVHSRSGPDQSFQATLLPTVLHGLSDDCVIRCLHPVIDHLLRETVDISVSDVPQVGNNAGTVGKKIKKSNSKDLF